MATRRDQLQSYQFMTQRVISAFVMRETDPRQSPLRRGIGAVFGGIMVAVLVAAGFGVYGIVTKVGSGSWKSEGSVVIEKETGASFVYLGGALHPTLNYASAMLVAGRPFPVVFRVAGNSLGSVPRGVTVGIPGAPDSLPAAAKRVGLPWTMCATSSSDSSGQPVNLVTLSVSLGPAAGQPLTDEAILVKDADLGMTYLVWHGRRYLLQQSRLVIAALFGAATPIKARTAWLNALPAGLDIAPITVSGRGTPSAVVHGRKVGDVLVTETGSGPQPYLVFDDGLAPITQLQQTVLSAETKAAPIQVPVSEAAAAPRSGRLRTPTGDGVPPAAPPTLAPATTGPVCAVTNDAKTPPVLWTGGTIPGADAAIPTGSVTAGGVALADRVLVPGGRVAIVRVLAAPTATSGPYYVITDLGIKYGVPSAGALNLLGYSPEQAVDVPSSLVSTVPAGPALDPAAAGAPATSGS
jgi:type VII secretion protein EccB